MYTKEEYKDMGMQKKFPLILTNKILKLGHVPLLTIVDRNNISPRLAKNVDLYMRVSTNHIFCTHPLISLLQ